jgi:hypothetical protein
MNHYIHGWNIWLTDEELAETLNIGRNIERKTKGVSKWAKEVEKANQTRGGKAF